MSLLNFLAANTVQRPSGFWPMLLRFFSFIPDYAWRVIVFTILLKVILSPLDFYSKFIMKKNSKITQRIKPEIEKLQKKYGDDKMGLQRAQMALQKAAGVKTFASCLPMIVPMIVFITFFTGMRKVGSYTEFQQYVHRYEVYSARYYELTDLEFTQGVTADLSLLDNIRDSEGYETNFDDIIIRVLDRDGLPQQSKDAWQFYNDNTNFKGAYDTFAKLDSETSFFSDISLFEVKPSASVDTTGLDILKVNGEYDLKKMKALIQEGNTSAQFIAAKDDAYMLIDQKLDAAVTRIQADNLLKAEKDRYVIPADYVTFSFADFDDVLNHYEKFEEFNQVNKSFNALTAIAEQEAALAVKLDYMQNDDSFMWIKSIWRPDSPISWKFPFTFKKLEVVSNYQDFTSRVDASYKYMAKNEGELDPAVYAAIKGETNYDKIMGGIRADEDLSTVNGWFILAILAVALSLFSQLITTRQQKRSGQMMAAGGGMAMNMKIMMIVMPIMIGVFALSSTTAFTLYMITNSAMSLMINLLTTLILNTINKTKGEGEILKGGVVKYGRRDPNDFIKKD